METEEHPGLDEILVRMDHAKAWELSLIHILGIKKERKSLGYAVDDVNAKELMKNKSTNALNSLAGKVAGVTITQTSGAVSYTHLCYSFCSLMLPTDIF